MKKNQFAISSFSVDKMNGYGLATNLQIRFTRPSEADRFVSYCKLKYDITIYLKKGVTILNLKNAVLISKYEGRLFNPSQSFTKFSILRNELCLKFVYQYFDGMSKATFNYVEFAEM